MEQINHFVPLLKKMYIKACLFDLNEDITIDEDQFIQTSKTFFEKLDPNNHSCTTYKQGCVHCEFDKVMKAKTEFDEMYKDEDPNIRFEHFIHNQDDEIKDFREAVLDLLLYLPLFSKKTVFPHPHLEVMVKDEWKDFSVCLKASRSFLFRGLKRLPAFSSLSQ